MRIIKSTLILLFGVLIGGVIMRFGPSDIFDDVFKSVDEKENELNYLKDKYERFEALDEILK
ncbi:MAG: hypothetical protein EOM23_06225 [Candidatus Moranbacteria bacterium]|nr:hypothetical protein [Candidatus Moranbacteria bacterium]